MTLAGALPHALPFLSAVAQGRRLVFFLDYDGTLCPIMADPDRAIICDDTRDAVRALSKRYTTAIVSGRSLAKVRSLVAIDHLIYAGSHGFDIQGPAGTPTQHTVGAEVRPALEAVGRYLNENVLSKYPASTLEDNKYSMSVHFRNCPAHVSITSLEADVDAAAARYGLRKTHGKKVFELRPKLNWHKGKAVEYLLEVLQLSDPTVLPVYIGDDVTDEDAFRALSRRGGVSVVVEGSEEAHNRVTAANCRLEDTHEVHQFLTHFADAPSPPLKQNQACTSPQKPAAHTRQHLFSPQQRVPKSVQIVPHAPEPSTGIAVGGGDNLAVAAAKV